MVAFFLPFARKKNLFFAFIIAPSPMVMAVLEHPQDYRKSLQWPVLFLRQALRHEYRPFGLSAGSLKPMCPFLPMPKICRSYGAKFLYPSNRIPCKILLYLLPFRQVCKCFRALRLRG